MVTIGNRADGTGFAMSLGDQFGVAVLAVLASLVIRRLHVPRQVYPFLPLVLSILLVWFFGSVGGFDSIRSGAVSGLLASGLLFLILGSRIQ